MNSSRFSRGRATTRSEFLKVPPGAGDNLSAEDIAAGYTDYVIWNRFRATELDIDGELEMECVNSGMVLLKGDSASIASAQPRNDMQGLTAQEFAHAFNNRSRQARSAHDAGLDPSSSTQDDEGIVQDDILERVLKFAYGNRDVKATLLLGV